MDWEFWFLTWWWKNGDVFSQLRVTHCLEGKINHRDGDPNSCMFGDSAKNVFGEVLYLIFQMLLYTARGVGNHLLKSGLKQEAHSFIPQDVLS